MIDVLMLSIVYSKQPMKRTDEDGKRLIRILVPSKDLDIS